MSESQGKSGAQFRADDPQEQETVRTTIVGGRPPGSGQRLGPIPRGVEVLVRKASVDSDFKRVLLAERAGAARGIDLTLDPAETMMLAAVPEEQLKAIIDRTTVPQEHRRAFLGTAAAAMFAALGLIATGCGAPKGMAPDDPTLDENGRPKRDRMRGEGGADPGYDDPDDDGSAPEPDGDDSAEPESADSADATGRPDAPRDLTLGIRPDRFPAPTGIRPDPGSENAAPE